MIVVTGAAGFIGSNLVSALNEAGYTDLILVDDFTRERKRANYEGKTFTALVDREAFPAWLEENHRLVQFVFHLGARTDTAEFDWDVFLKLNLDYTKKVWNTCVEYGLPLVYASSAATYGDGALGYKDDHALVPELKPLNPYGESKNEFDKWALKQERQPFFWAGLKFFNVYGPNEYHKDRMASVVMHTYRQIQETGGMKLFRSHRADFKDGEQMRDFIYVKDAVQVMLHLMTQRKHSGIYNLGTGKARTFYDLAAAVFTALDKEVNISFVDTPEDIRDKYQYYTQAEMDKLLKTAYETPFTSLEEGIKEYVQEYLKDGFYA